MDSDGILLWTVMSRREPGFAIMGASGEYKHRMDKNRAGMACEEANYSQMCPSYHKLHT